MIGFENTVQFIHGLISKNPFPKELKFFVSFVEQTLLKVK